jgi:undecaprenyl diphosphate synthase
MGSDIDLVIRTGKEKRLSGFFPWQTIYSEWFFLDIYFPELTKDILKKVLEDFYERQRRFGS